MKKIPLPAIERLSNIYGLLEKLERNGIKTVSSTQIGKNINTTNATVRKDISYLSMPSVAGRDYDIAKLKKYIGQDLKLFKPRKACIIGLGRIGSAILAYEGFKEEGFEIAAGFDVNLNKIEMIVSKVSLHLIHELKSIIESRGIEIGFICTPPEAAQETANKLVDAHIKGIINCTTAMVSVPEEVIIRNIDYTGYLRIVSALISQKK
ncbi:MAG: redox-sensing transcriptional repressor Rex [bacterium]|nr:redox-sensing transcriptional repressor Rex [bacterium]MDD5354551.1 redox-sensing transcriptional repressor Rex [bacterium]